MLFSSAIRNCRTSLLFGWALIVWPNVSFACRAIPPDIVVLLDKVPAEAQESPVIARVVITTVYEEPRGGAMPQAYAKARVIEAIKGVEVGETIRLKASPYPCSSTLFLDDIDNDGLVAGEFNSDQVLVGFWNKRYKRLRNSP